MVVRDNSSSHRRPAARAWAGDNRMELVFLPTHGSWVNWIETERSSSGTKETR
jgi:hypothetical protein